MISNPHVLTILAHAIELVSQQGIRSLDERLAKIETTYRALMKIVGGSK